MNLISFLDIFQADDSCLYEVHNQIRVKFLKEWFTKCSFTFKVQTLKDLLSHIKSNAGKEMITKILENYPEKLLAYITYQIIPKMIGDRCLLDHNRCLEEATLKAVKEEYVVWFSELTDIAQITVFVDLLSVGGPAVVIKLQNLYHQSTLPRMQYTTNVSEKLQSIINDKAKTEDNVRIKNYNSNEPISQQLQLLNQNLNNSLKKYAIALDKQTKKIYGVATVKDKTKKKKVNTKALKKSNKTTKKSKSKIKKSKSSKKMKKGKKEKEEVDWLQTLPVWIVKNIFNYLDVKTLKNVKVVNSYWAFIIDQLTLDRKARKTIDKHIKQSEETLKELEASFPKHWNFVEKPETTRKDLSSRNDKFLIGRGALHHKLKPKFLPGEFRRSNIHGELEFPHISMKTVPLTRKVSCVLDEAYYLNLKHKEEDLQCPSNFL